MARRENDFSVKTRQIVAGRAGYRCSIPGCDRVTIGPDVQPSGIANTGKAAHIFSASSNGPRGCGGLTPEQLKSANNALWLCAEHAELVDKNRGERYPSSLLQTYKGLREAKAAREQGGLHAQMCWFQQLVVRSSPLFVPHAKLQFGTVTLITGANLGKSALCDWLAGFGDPTALWRWLPKGHGHSELHLEVLCHMPEQQVVRMMLTRKGELKFSVNERESPIQPLPLKFVFIREEKLLTRSADIDDVGLICEQLNVDPVTLPNLFPFVENYGFGWARNLRLIEEKDEEDDSSRLVIVADIRGTRPGLPFRALSHSEQTCLLIELAVALARFSAQYIPTMLLLDGGMHRLGPELFNELADKLSSPLHLFQTVIVVPNRPEHIANLRWTGWEIVNLQQSSQGTLIDQPSI